MLPRALVIGCGNTLRADDGAAAALIALARRESADSDVEWLVCQQLTVELAPRVAECQRLIVIDAATDLPPGAVSVRPLAEAGGAAALTHHLSPEALLAVASTLYGARPQAFLLTIGCESLELGEALTLAVQAALPEAAGRLRELLRS
jgi:hydrogenase maturation protease